GQEFRTEAWTETPAENRFDRRLELDFGVPSDSDGREFPTAASDFESVEFNNAVATPSEVLGVGPIASTEDNFDDFDEERFDTSGGLF
ncbi:hypothetical protein, partial [Haloarcula argentinensis]|uniref:hypothetical protein n=1 Tax=Haloarcula argentinensis TaxID=43776 RepID=UPI001662D544